MRYYIADINKLADILEKSEIKENQINNEKDIFNITSFFIIYQL